jgi:hypothetical protein
LVRQQGKQRFQPDDSGQFEAERGPSAVRSACGSLIQSGVALQPERDWIDYLSFAINVVAAAGSLFAVFLAVKAYQSAKKANDLAERQGRESRGLVARERRTTFELEVLRDLLGWIDDRDVIRSIAEGGMPFSNSRVGCASRNASRRRPRLSSPRHDNRRTGPPPSTRRPRRRCVRGGARNGCNARSEEGCDTCALSKTR